MRPLLRPATPLFTNFYQPSIKAVIPMFEYNSNNTVNQTYSYKRPVSYLPFNVPCDQENGQQQRKAPAILKSRQT